MSTPLRDTLLRRAQDDWVCFAEIVALLHDQEPVPPAALLHRACLIAGDMIRAGYWNAGELTPDGFRPWSGDAAEQEQRIRRALDQHTGGLFPGDICWFCLTTAGEAALQQDGV